jgi:hypothetical protein
MRKRTYTIAEASELTGLSRKAVARRIERGSLQSLVRGGRRVVPHAELVRAGLVAEDGEANGPVDPAGLLSPHPPPGDADGAPTDVSVVASLMRELVDRLERQAGEIAQFRALTVQAESLRLERELVDLRTRLATLEGQGQTAELGQSPAAPSFPTVPPAARPAASRQPAGQRIWLPPSAASMPAGQQQPPGRTSPPAEASPGWQSPRTGLPRMFGFVLEAAFIVAVAAGAWQADLAPRYVVAAVAAAWLLVAVLEWYRWSDRRR